MDFRSKLACWFLNLSISCGAGLWAATSTAAEIEAVTLEDGSSIIFFIGDIEPGDADNFRRIAATSKSTAVILESSGGSTIEAIEIGKVVRVLDLATLVLNDSQCNSACALIWLAGTPRTLSRSAKIGFHASYTDQMGLKMESGVGNALVGRYLTQLDLPISAVIFATKAPPESLAWLDATNFSKVGIDASVVADFDSSEEDSSPDHTATPLPPPIETTSAAPPRKDTTLFEEVEEWMIMTDHTLAGSCFLVRYYPDGTILRLSNDARYTVTDGNGFILLTNPAWASLISGREVPITFRFGSFDPWDAVASVTELGGFNWLNISFSGESGSDLKTEFGTANAMSLIRDNKIVAGIDLASSRQALGVLNRCQSAANAARLKADPFAN